MQLKFDNERPIYIQLVEKIRISIISGLYPLDSKIPSVRELALTYKVNPNTIQKALIELEQEKLIYTERTNGKFVTKDEKLIERKRLELSSKIMNTYLLSMQEIGINKKDAIKYLQEGDKNDSRS